MRCRGNALEISVALVALMAAAAAHGERNIDRDLRTASQSGDLPEMERQLQLGADPNVAYALFAAADGGQLQAVQFLLAHGADPNAWMRLAIRLPLGPAASPLYAAARHGNNGLVAYLKTHGADLDAASTNPSSATCSTVLIEALCEGDLTAARSLVEAGAEVNRRSNAGPPPLTLALRAPKDRLALVEHVKPRPPGQLPAEEPLDVDAALHYKAVCDIGEPGYAEKMRVDYDHWRSAQAAVVAQVESAPDYLQRVAAARQEFEKHREEASGADAQQFNESLHQVCDVLLAEHFRTGAPLFAQARRTPEVQAAETQVLTRSNVPTVTTVTRHRKAGTIVGGSAAPSP